MGVYFLTGQGPEGGFAIAFLPQCFDGHPLTEPRYDGLDPLEPCCQGRCRGDAGGRTLTAR